MKISQAGLDFIKDFEKCELEKYICPALKPTIGWGHVILDHESIPDIITQQQADELLRQDVAWAESRVETEIPHKFKQSEFDMLVSLVFNIGSGNFNTSTIRKKLIEQDDPAVFIEWPKWRRGSGKILPGLVRRRAAERRIFFDREYAKVRKIATARLKTQSNFEDMKWVLEG